ncbi:TetR/AcrR family transcriptional regulator [Chengkuizengella axinellae]|uniref:Helix-turn-helix domain-containing protein n=1 Tax=Chengkuizengella axinellae TaxID=3064388 RepID=A0ABT9J4L9_9BACL|nr:TetR/AcrR family transcriptional regulator [Chengkuizengella sp. 2205SS18-9]MDP5276546.1 helix-turn-helix domain-containing protein [Chengkuizengella sp. 2205SS18-9]
MDHKKKLIIEASLKLFSEKGFYSTSVQDIAELCSISKASLYKFFPSKEELFIKVFEYHQNIMFEKAASYSFDKTLSPKELLHKQLCTQIEDFLELKDFILMQLKSIPADENNKLAQMMKRMKSRIILWQKECISQAYGKNIEPYVWDLTLTIQGLIKEYLSLLSSENKNVNVTALATTLIDRLDAIVKDLTSHEPQPLFTHEMMNQYLQLSDTSLSKSEEVSTCLIKLQSDIRDLDNECNRENLLNSVAMLKDEINAVQSREFLLDALLKYIEKEKSLEPTAAKLRSLIL